MYTDIIHTKFPLELDTKKVFRKNYCRKQEIMTSNTNACSTLEFPRVSGSTFYFPNLGESMTRVPRLDSNLIRLRLRLDSTQT